MAVPIPGTLGWRAETWPEAPLGWPAEFCPAGSRIVIELAPEDALGLLQHEADVLSIFQTVWRLPDRTFFLLSAAADVVQALVAVAALRRPRATANLWVGARVRTAADLAAAVKPLLETPAAGHFLVCEPPAADLELGDLLGPCPCRVDRLVPGLPKIEVRPECRRHSWLSPLRAGVQRGLGWVVVRGQYGGDQIAKPLSPRALRRLADQCRARRVPFLFAGWGQWLPAGQDLADPRNPVFLVAYERWIDGTCYGRIDPAIAGYRLDGREWLEYPERGPGPVPAGAG